jgi:hypothetical protein
MRGGEFRSLIWGREENGEVEDSMKVSRSLEEEQSSSDETGCERRKSQLEISIVSSSCVCSG